MNVNAKVTILFGGSDYGMKIEVHDADSSETFLELELTPDQVCTAFGRLSYTGAARCLLRNVDRVGKQLEHKEHIFEFNYSECEYYKRKEMAKIAAINTCPDGWKPDCGFHSRESFFNEDGIEYAKTTIRRWV